jgi:hypothetical protein
MVCVALVALLFAVSLHAEAQQRVGNGRHGMDETTHASPKAPGSMIFSFVVRYHALASLPNEAR